MKILNSLLIILTFLIAMSTTSELLAQTVKGDGNVIKQPRSLTSFNEIRIGGTVNVYLSQGSLEAALVETDANLVKYIETNVKDGVLEIGIMHDVEIKKATKIEVYVTLKDVKKISNNGVGNVSTEGTLNVPTLKIESEGVGNFTLSLDCENFSADVNSVGNLTLSGRAANVKIDNNSVGNIKAFDLVAEVLRIQNNGVGNAQVNSSKEIFIDLNGIGNVSYKGDAVVKALNVNGVGKINKE